MDILLYIFPALVILALVGRRLIKSERRHFSNDRRHALPQATRTSAGKPIRLVIWARDRRNATKTVLTIPPNRTTVSLELNGMAVWYVPGASKSLFLCSSSADMRTDIVNLELDKETHVKINGVLFCCYPTEATSNVEAFANASV